MKMKFNREDSGQALVEMSFGFIIMCVFVFGAIDFGRAVYDVQVMRNLAGEGSSMGSRGTKLPQTVTTVANYAGTTIDLKNQGMHYRDRGDEQWWDCPHHGSGVGLRDWLRQARSAACRE